MDYIHRFEDEAVYEAFLFDIQEYKYTREYNCLKAKVKFKDEYNAIHEAIQRECWNTDPHFPGEE